jgi:hypothetical protein
LLKIREKNNGTASHIGIEASANNAVCIGQSLPAEQGTMKPQMSCSLGRPIELKPILNESLADITLLIRKAPPLSENDSDILTCIDVLKNIHAAVSKQTNLAVDVEAANIWKLRKDIKCRISEVVKTLTLLIDVGFNCHDVSYNAGWFHCCP